MKKLFDIVDKLNRLLWNIAAFMLTFIALATFYEVICRYVFNRSNVWVGEYGGYLFAFIAFLAAPYAYSQGGMTTVDALVSKFPPKVRRVLKMLSILISLFFLVILCQRSTALMMLNLQKGWKSASSLKTPLWIPMTAVPAGSLLLCLTSVVLFLKEIVAWVEECKKEKEGEN